LSLAPELLRHPEPWPRKSCNWNCVYCQLGKTRPYSLARSSYFPLEALRAELLETLDSESSHSIDWITFVGGGEPTLNRDLGAMIRMVKQMTKIPVAVITNGSLLSLEEVRQELSEADAVLPTLDAGDAAQFKRINRPHPDFRFERHIEGLADFARSFAGRLWIEVMLIEGLNDDNASLENLAKKIALINPAEIHLVLPTRPPAEPWIHPAGAEGIARAMRILGRTCPVLHPSREYGGFSAEGESDHLAAAMNILKRHPMTDDELRRFLAQRGISEAEPALAAFRDAGQVFEIDRNGVKYWRAK
jgi:wyosine [tRNA(Phe)-imidazoG37] synthetase (radical SAM superfamily)